jgi:hypothetical protein
MIAAVQVRTFRRADQDQVSGSHVSQYAIQSFLISARLEHQIDESGSAEFTEAGVLRHPRALARAPNPRPTSGLKEAGGQITGEVE